MDADFAAETGEPVARADPAAGRHGDGRAGQPAAADGAGAAAGLRPSTTPRKAGAIRPPQVRRRERPRSHAPALRPAAARSTMKAAHGHDDQFCRHRQRPGRQLDRLAAGGDRAAAADRAADQGDDDPDAGLGVRQDQERRLDPARPGGQARRARRPGARPSATRRAARSSAHRPTTGAGSYTVEVQALASAQTIATGAAAPATTHAGRRHAAHRARHLGRRADQLHAQGRRHRGRHRGRPRPTRWPTVRDKINAAGAGVTALIMTDASGSRLVIRSSDPGAANALPHLAASPSLAFDPSAGVATMTQSQTAADAAATINGLAVTSAEQHAVEHRRRPDAEPARTLTTGPVTVNVVTDTRSAEEDDHRLRRRLHGARQADRRPTPSTTPTTKTGGILQGDSAAVGLQRQLRTLAGSASARLDAVRPPVGRRPRAAGRRLADGQRDQARQRARQPGRAEEDVRQLRPPRSDARTASASAFASSPTPCSASTAR